MRKRCIRRRARGQWIALLTRMMSGSPVSWKSGWRPLEQATEDRLVCIPDYYGFRRLASPKQIRRPECVNALPDYRVQMLVD